LFNKPSIEVLLSSTPTPINEMCQLDSDCMLVLLALKQLKKTIDTILVDADLCFPLQQELSENQAKLKF